MKRIVFRNLFLTVVLTVFFVAVGCGSKQETAKSYDFKALDLVKELAEKMTFEDVVGEVSNEKLVSHYELDESDVKDMAAYMSSAATAEEIAVFICKDGAAADNIKKKCDLRIENQIKVYESYAPAEVERLKNSYVEKKSNLVILCVSNDKAKISEVVDGFLKDK